jgi:hypothetical protein
VTHIEGRILKETNEQCRHDQIHAVIGASDDVGKENLIGCLH